jgi:hypothetical protein
MTTAIGKIYGKKLWFLLSIFCMLGVIQLAMVFALRNIMVATRAAGEVFVTFTFFIFCILLSLKLLDFSRLDRNHINVRRNRLFSSLFFNHNL